MAFEHRAARWRGVQAARPGTHRSRRAVRGVSETVVDTPRLALYVAREPSARRASTAVLRGSALQPVSSRSAPSKPESRLSGRVAFPAATTLFALRPQLPESARSFEVTAIRPDGSREVLLRVRRVRFEWQSPFVFASRFRCRRDPRWKPRALR